MAAILRVAIRQLRQDLTSARMAADRWRDLAGEYSAEALALQWRFDRLAAFLAELKPDVTGKLCFYCEVDGSYGPHHDKRCPFYVGDETRKAPDTVLMPRALTAENGAKAATMGEFTETIECADEDGEETTREVYVSWTNIKAIYAKAVELFGR